MKRILALILALCVIFALVACGETQTEEKAAEPETIEPEDENAFLYKRWKSLFGGGGVVKISEDGTARIFDYAGTWEMNGETLVVSYTDSDNRIHDYEFTIMDIGGETILYRTYEFYAAEDRFDQGAEALKSYMLENAEELDWRAAHNRLIHNETAAQEEYNGKIVRWKATAYDIRDGYVYMANETDGGYPLNPVNVYLSKGDLSQMTSSGEYEVVGILVLGGFSYISSAFIVK